MNDITAIGSEFLIERINVVEFPYINARFIRIEKLTRGTVKVNNLKIYTPLLDAGNVPISPTTELAWSIQIEQL